VGEQWPVASGQWPVGRAVVLRLIVISRMANGLTLFTDHWPLTTGHWPLTTGHWPLTTGHCHSVDNKFMARVDSGHQRS